MEFDLGWILLGLPVSFALGWLASRMDVRQLRVENREVPKAYFKGLNFLLNEQQDMAIDAFIEAMQSDPDTAELHFALGNLFRRRGEFGRAVRVHEHLLSRADLTAADRERAQHGLAQDYLKAGLLDRAEEALRRLEGTAYEGEARLALLAIYERSRDWEQAAAIARSLHAAQHGDFGTRLAHYLCEQAAEQARHTSADAALALLQQALDTAASAVRPRLELAHLQHRLHHSDAAWDTLLGLVQAAPQGLPLAVTLLLDVAVATHRESEAVALLRQRYAQAPSLDVLEALVQLAADPDGQGGDRCPGDAARCGRDWYVRHLDKEPSLVAATRWLAGEDTLADVRHRPAVLKALEHATKPLTRYRCAACGFEARQYFWHCPGCQSWDSYPARRVEEM